MSESAALEGAPVCDVGEEHQVHEELESSPAPATPAPTFGQVAPRLRALGYHVGSVFAPEFQGPDTLLSEDPIVIRNVGLLILAPIADKELDARVRQLLEQYNLLSGPVRVDSNGIECYPLSQDPTYVNRLFRALDGAFLLYHGMALRLNADWPRGELTDTPRAELPSIGDHAAGKLVERLEQLKWERAQELRPKPRPSRLGLIGR